MTMRLAGYIESDVGLISFTVQETIHGSNHIVEIIEDGSPRDDVSLDEWIDEVKSNADSRSAVYYTSREQFKNGKPQSMDSFLKKLKDKIPDA